MEGLARPAEIASPASLARAGHATHSPRSDQPAFRREPARVDTVAEDSAASHLVSRVLGASAACRGVAIHSVSVSTHRQALSAVPTRLATAQGTAALPLVAPVKPSAATPASALKPTPTIAAHAAINAPVARHARPGSALRPRPATAQHKLQTTVF